MEENKEEKVLTRLGVVVSVCYESRMGNTGVER